MNIYFRRERVLSRSVGKAAQRSAPAAGLFNSQQSPSSTWSPTPSPTSPVPTHVYYTPVMDEPLALIKKPRKDPENTEEKTKSTATSQIQVIYQKKTSYACIFNTHFGRSKPFSQTSRIFSWYNSWKVEVLHCMFPCSLSVAPGYLQQWYISHL